MAFYLLVKPVDSHNRFSKVDFRLDSNFVTELEVGLAYDFTLAEVSRLSQYVEMAPSDSGSTPPRVSGAPQLTDFLVDNYQSPLVDDDTAIEYAIAAAEAFGDGTPVLFTARTYEIADFHQFVTTPPVGVPGSTVLLATADTAGIGIGPPLGSIPTNLNRAAIAGGFLFDGDGVAARGVETNTVNWHYMGIAVLRLAADADGLSIYGQNNKYDKLDAWSSGDGFCLVFDGGCGGNVITSPSLVGENHIVFRQTINSIGLGYWQPQNNVVDCAVTDQVGVPGDYCVLHTAGVLNVLRDCNFYHAGAAGLVKFEQNASVGYAPLNGRLILEGVNQMSAGGAGQYFFWADFKTAGAAGAMNGDVALNLYGHLVLSGTAAGDFKWGTSTPVVAGDTQIVTYGATRPLWTPDGTGAQPALQGNWRIGARSQGDQAGFSKIVQMQPSIDALSGLGSWGFLSVAGLQGGFVYYNYSDAIGDLLNFFVRLDAGIYEFSFLGYISTNLGILELSLTNYEGVEIIGTIDLYSAATAYNAKMSISGIDVVVASDYTLTVRCVGKNAASSNKFITLPGILSMKRTT